MDNRKRIYSLFIKLCKYLGFLNKEKVENKDIYKWNFPNKDFLSNKINNFDEEGYFDKLSKVNIFILYEQTVKIEVKKQPAKNIASSLDVNLYN